MIIDFISDTHLNYKHLEGKLTGDVLVHCGDWSRDGSEEETEAFLEWLAPLPHKHKIIVPGNHERFVEKLYREEWPNLTHMLDYYQFNCEHNGSGVIGEGNLTILLDSFTKIDGVKFYGMPWTQFYNHWAFAYDNSTHAKELCDAIPMDTDILITHGPAFGVFDENSHRHQLGCTYVRDAVARVKPTIHAFGHVHECGGMHQREAFTESLNCARNHFQREVFTNVINRGDPKLYKRNRTKTEE